MNEFLLAHGWRLVDQAGLPRQTMAGFLRPAVRAVPKGLAARLGSCRVILLPRLEDAISRWTQTEGRLEIELATEEVEPHDLALELLVCLGQALWESASAEERAAYLVLLEHEIAADVSGEIDEDALEEKRRLLSSPLLARSPRRLERYAAASFAGTAAEYVHALWHDVTVRTGPDYLPAEWLRRRLELLAHWFPPPRGRRLFSGGQAPVPGGESGF